MKKFLFTILILNQCFGSDYALGKSLDTIDYDEFLEYFEPEADESFEEEGMIDRDYQCVDLVAQVYYNSQKAWYAAIHEHPSPAKNAVYSASEYSRRFYDIYRMIPTRYDRTRGIYLELEDRIEWALRLSRECPWENQDVYRFIQAAGYNLERLGACYNR